MLCKKKVFRKYISIIIFSVVILACPLRGLCIAAADVKPAMDRAADYLLSRDKNQDRPLSPWSYTALASAGWKLDGTKAGESYGLQLSSARTTADYARLVLALLAGGEDPCAYQGQNLVAKIQAGQMPDGKFADNIDGTGQGDAGGQILLNAHVWAIMALYSAGADIPDAAGAGQWIVSRQHSDGGFNWLLTETASDVDSTGMALLALAAVGEGKNSPAVRRACTYLKGVQEPDGGFRSWGAANPESCSTVIEALTALGIDPESEMVVPGGSPLTALLDFQRTDGSFAHIKGGAANEMATQQALLALSDTFYGKTFYDRLREKSKLLSAASESARIKITFKPGLKEYIIQDGARERKEDADAAPFIESGRLYVPVRYLASALGIPDTGIKWSPSDQAVTLTDKNISVTLYVGGDIMYVNDIAQPRMDVVPLSRGGRVYLPACFVAESLGCRVAWDEAEQKVEIFR